MTTTSSDGMVGRVLASRYAVDEKLGAGTMGAVYRAHHVKMGRLFAIKVLHKRMMQHPKVLKRFQREAEIAGKLRHPNVVGVVDVGETDDGMHYLVMEYAPGVSLASKLNEAPMPAERVIALARQLCDGLAHAHGHGLIHRDFKPENVIVDRDAHGREHPRIVDFGIAIVRDVAETSSGEQERLTTAGLVVGTPHYMAPEQARGDHLDHRADLFALGLILYELLTGVLPFDGSGVDIARANMFTETPSMSIRVPTVVVDPLLEALVRKLLEKDREKRPASASEVRELLDMVEHHRTAATKALGLPSVPAARRFPRSSMSPVKVDEALAPTQSVQIPTEPIPRAQTEPPVAEWRTQSELDDRTSMVTSQTARKRRAAIIIAVAIAAGVLIGAGIRMLVRDDTSEAPALEVASPILDEAPTVTPEPPTVAPPVREPAPPRETPKLPTPAKQLPTPKPPVAQPAPVAPTNPAIPTAAEIAQLYGAVGRELKALDNEKGDEATYDLWPRFRWIRINDVLLTEAKRAHASELLEQLRKDIRARRANP